MEFQRAVHIIGINDDPYVHTVNRSHMEDQAGATYESFANMRGVEERLQQGNVQGVIADLDIHGVFLTHGLLQLKKQFPQVHFALQSGHLTFPGGNERNDHPDATALRQAGFHMIRPSQSIEDFVEKIRKSKQTG